jgi:hypothetical protein
MGAPGVAHWILALPICATPAHVTSHRQGRIGQVIRQDGAVLLTRCNVVVRRDQAHSTPLKSSFAYC